MVELRKWFTILLGGLLAFWWMVIQSQYLHLYIEQVDMNYPPVAAEEETAWQA